jgi:hypothetical protein
MSRSAARRPTNVEKKMRLFEEANAFLAGNKGRLLSD